MLDLILAPQTALDTVRTIRSDRSYAFASHHFPVIAHMSSTTVSCPKKTRQCKPDWSVLQVPQLRRDVWKAIAMSLDGVPRSGRHTEWAEASRRVLEVAEELLPRVQKTANKPWISKDTFDLIQQRNEARRCCSWVEERYLGKLIKSAARRDKAS